MDSLDRDIQRKQAEIETLSKMLDNAKRDLKTLEAVKKEREKQ